MPPPDKKQALFEAVHGIRSAGQLLLDESKTTSDVGRLIQINNEFTRLDSCLSQLLHAQALTDDAEFEGAAVALKSQAAALQVEQEKIQKLVASAEKGAKIAGHLARAAQAIAAL